MNPQTEDKPKKLTPSELAQKKIARELKAADRRKAKERAADDELAKRIEGLKATAARREQAERTRLRLSIKTALGELAVRWVEATAGKRKLEHEAFKAMSADDAAALAAFIEGLKPSDATPAADAVH